MVFPVVMYGCESWTVKKAERRRIDADFYWQGVFSGHIENVFFGAKWNHEPALGSSN